LHRSTVEAADRVVPQLEVLHRELPADHHERTPASRPTAVVLDGEGQPAGLLFERYFLMIDAVEKLDDVALDLDRMRNGNFADVLILLEHRRRARTAEVAEAVTVRRATKDGPSGDLTQALLLEELETRLEHRKAKAHALADLGSGQLAAEVQRLQHELQDDVA